MITVEIEQHIVPLTEGEHLRTGTLVRAVFDGKSIGTIIEILSCKPDATYKIMWANYQRPWSVETAEDLKAFYNIDIEDEISKFA